MRWLTDFWFTTTSYNASFSLCLTSLIEISKLGSHSEKKDPLKLLELCRGLTFIPNRTHTYVMRGRKKSLVIERLITCLYLKSDPSLWRFRLKLKEYFYIIATKRKKRSTPLFWLLLKWTIAWDKNTRKWNDYLRPQSLFRFSMAKNELQFSCQCNEMTQ